MQFKGVTDNESAYGDTNLIVSIPNIRSLRFDLISLPGFSVIARRSKKAPTSQLNFQGSPDFSTKIGVGFYQP